MKRMKKYIVLALALCTALSLSACGKNNSKESGHADKLVKGKIAPKANIADDAKDLSKEAVPENEPEEYTSKEPIADDEDIVLAEYGTSIEQLDSIVDNAAEEYDLFSFMPVEAPDFFEEKTIRLALTIYNHETALQYEAGIDNVFTDDLYTIRNEQLEESYNVYAVSDRINITPNGNQYSYVIYGADNTDVTVGIMTRVRMSDDIDMGDAAANDHIMLLSAAQSGMMYVFKAE